MVFIENIVFLTTVKVCPEIAIVFLEIHIVNLKSRLWINFSIKSSIEVICGRYYWASDLLTLIKLFLEFMHMYYQGLLIMK
jgi:hypothetical protein